MSSFHRARERGCLRLGGALLLLSSFQGDLDMAGVENLLGEDFDPRERADGAADAPRTHNIILSK